MLRLRITCSEQRLGKDLADDPTESDRLFVVFSLNHTGLYLPPQFREIKNIPLV